MPELPDVLVYLERLTERIVGRPLEAVRLASPFVLRSVDPPLSAVTGREVQALRRIGKRIVWQFPDELFIVIHLMIAGRFHWRDEVKAKPRAKITLASFDFPSGTLQLTEASSKKRASLHVVRGEAQLHTFDRGGVEVLGLPIADFRAALTRENHTLKRALTDPRLLSGIGNAYSDEILHRARLSPVKLTDKLTDEEWQNLHTATQGTLKEWIARLQAIPGFPEKVTAFRDEMAVHGKYRQPCPTCGGPVQRIRYAENETNYCPRCQTGGKLLADRGLSRLLHGDWPKTLEELEERKSASRDESAGGTTRRR
jgi:formamidopyrimidine-DNA glycosylase